MEIPVLCWVCTVSPTISEEEYNLCVKAVQEAWPDSPFAIKLSDAPRTYGTLREIIAHIVPLLMMRQQRVSRSKWKLYHTDRGKKWIERDPEGMHPSRHLTSMMGYATATAHNLVVMAAAQGKRHQVVNIGLDVKRMVVEGVPVSQWAQSVAHKLTPVEIELLSGLPDDKLLSRLFVILTVKESLINGLGQPVGFDLSRIECNVPEGSIRVDGQPLLGWEFRLFRSVHEVPGPDEQGGVVKEPYQITIAFYRGNNISKFHFVENPVEIERLTQYFPLENLLRVIPKLLQDTPNEI